MPTRNACGLCALFALAACFNVRFGDNLRCGEADVCPDKHSCVDGVCVASVPVGDASVVPSIDAIPADARTAFCGGAATDCATLGAVFCDNFETDISAWTFDCNGDNYQCSPDIPEVELGFVTAPVCRGGQAFRIALAGGPGTKQNGYLGLETPLPETFFLRVFVYVPSGSNIEDTSIYLGFVTEGDSVRIGFAGPGQLQVRLAGNYLPFDAPWQRDHWHCLEAKFAPDELTVWFDDVQAASFAQAVVPVGATFSGATFGPAGSSNLGFSEIIGDEYVLATERVGCY